MNQIKEDFITSRMLLVLAQYESDICERISKRTYYSTIESCKFSMNIGLLKSSFKEAYDILDKIAVFINRYYSLGLREKNVDFLADDKKRSIWKAEDGEMPEIIRKSENICLYSLYDVYMDMKSDFGERFQEIRNALVHRKLFVISQRALPQGKKVDGILFNDLLSLTIQLLKFVKSTIVYLINLITIEEGRRRATQIDLIRKLNWGNDTS